MNLADLPPPPPGSNLSIVAESDGVVITLRRELFAGLVEVGVFLTLVMIVLFLPNAVVPWIPVNPANAWWNPAGPYLFWLAFLVMQLAIVGKRAYEREDGAIFFISPTRFAVATCGIITNRGFVWSRQRLRHIAAWQGLRVAAKVGHLVVLLKERNPRELRYVEEVARLLLDLPPEPVRSPDELAVTYQGTFWGEPEEGVLHIEPGRLTLAHPLADKPHLKFVASDGWFRHWWFGESITLSPSDLVCRLDEEGNCRLEIAPTEVHGGRSWLGMLPRISIAPLGRGFTLSRDLLDCQVMRLPARNVPFRLVLRCDDPEALPRAVARFWGNREG